MNAHTAGMYLDRELLPNDWELGGRGGKLSEYHVFHLFTSISSTLWKTKIARIGIIPRLDLKVLLDMGLGWCWQIPNGRWPPVGTSANIHREIMAVTTVFQKQSRMFSLFSIARRVSEMKTTEAEERSQVFIKAHFGNTSKPTVAGGMWQEKLKTATQMQSGTSTLSTAQVQECGEIQSVSI